MSAEYTSYDSEARPLVHFTPYRGYMNDPNGLCRYDGRYFLFFQHNPGDVFPGNTHWGKAVSSDLIHWKQCAPAICPDDEDGNIFSGSAVVDVSNVSGLGEGDVPPILLFYTGTGFHKAPVGEDGIPLKRDQWDRPATRQCIAYSTDGGETFIKYKGNPILPEYAPLNRDPKVNWVPEENAFVMVLFLEKWDYMFFWSEDLLHWQEGQRISVEGTAECPDIFSLKLDGREDMKKWIFWGSPENYIVGRFENRTFVPETPLILGNMAARFSKTRRFGNFAVYAPQTYFLPGEDRVVQFSWMPTRFPGAPFKSQMSLPWELRLVSTKDGPRLRKDFADEVLALRKTCARSSGSDYEKLNQDLRAPRVIGQPGREALELCLSLNMGAHGRISFAIRGVPVCYDREKSRLSFPTGEYPLETDGTMDIRVIVDRGGAELFACKGLFNCALNTALDPGRNDVEFFALEDCTAEAELYELSL